MSAMTTAQLREFYLEACELDVQALKPGNVSIYAEGHDMTVQDFRASALLSADSLCNADYTLGEKMYYAVQATRAQVGCNTNLGIILLCAPLLQAALLTTSTLPFKAALELVLQNTTLSDAHWTFKAIALAAPGGLGKAPEQDVYTEPTLNLQQVMQLASHRDRIALQYISNFENIFTSVLRYNEGFGLWGQKTWAATWVYTELLSRYPDSHLERKYKNRYSALVLSKMSALHVALKNSSKPELLIAQCLELDQEFKLKGINPGTTADLTVATILTASLIDFFSVV